ncbi:DUF4856 domain-containing protein [Rhodohalobacter mucosus]|uniref:DUF4856 domain-containing protein n=1 Tax=Rhodohalobacter mucosus TaxID=2079485 RepID=A0A316TL81_9BACT|nr:DUF4856 domain-containing protein [Rhodohalobacter mucosus]
MYKKSIPLFLLAFILVSCVNDNNTEVAIDEPEVYEFTRNGSSTVSFSGQTARILMAEELISTMMDFDGATESLLLQMYRNRDASGGNADPFSNPELNSETKSIKEKVAASEDYFSSNASESVQIRNEFESWISGQVSEVFPNENTLASPGQAGQIADGTSVRYVNAQGLEYNQMVTKSLIGALMTDQMLNNYLSSSVLDAGTNREDNDNEVLVDGTSYTTMEHKWDEAYGYLFGAASNQADPLTELGSADSFLDKYLGRVENDDDFAGIAEEIFNAFKRGRAAIVAGAYDVRDEQAEIIRQRISEIIGIRAVFYLESAKTILEGNSPDYGAIFHDLSEAYGFIYSLQFTRVPGSDEPYFTGSEVQSFLDRMLGDGPNGLWDLTPETLDALSDDIAAPFNFSIEEAAG